MCRFEHHAPTLAPVSIANQQQTFEIIHGRFLEIIHGRFLVMYYRDEYMLYPTQDSIAMNLQRHPKKCVHQWGFVFLNQNLMPELEDSVIKKNSFSPIEKESLDLKIVNFLKSRKIKGQKLKSFPRVSLVNFPLGKGFTRLQDQCNSCVCGASGRKALEQTTARPNRRPYVWNVVNVRKSCPKQGPNLDWWLICFTMVYLNWFIHV